MIRVNLPDADLGRLRAAFRSSADLKLRHRLQIVLMAHRGRPHGDIATDLGCSRSSVQRWLNAYLAAGLDALTPRKAGGPAPRLSDDLAPLLKRWVTEGPAERGIDRANWTSAELADHLHKVKGIRVRKSAMPAFGARHGIRPYRPTYRYLRGDAAKQGTARGELAALKKGRPPAGSCL